MSASELHKSIIMRKFDQELVLNNGLISNSVNIGELSNGYKAVLQKLEDSFDCDKFIDIIKQSHKVLKEQPVISYSRKAIIIPNNQFEEAYTARKECHQVYNKLLNQIAEEDRKRVDEAFQKSDVTEPVLLMKYLEAYPWTSNPKALSLRREINPWNDDRTIDQKCFIKLSKTICSILQNKKNWVVKSDGQRVPNNLAKSAANICGLFLSFLRNSLEYNRVELIAETALKLNEVVNYPEYKPFKIVFGSKEAEFREAITINGMAKFIFSLISPVMDNTFTRMRETKLMGLSIGGLQRNNLIDMMRLSLGDELTTRYVMESNSPLNLQPRKALLDAYLDFQEPLTSNLERYQWGLSCQTAETLLIERIKLLDPQLEEDWKRAGSLLDKCLGSNKGNTPRVHLKEYVLQVIAISPHSLCDQLKELFSTFSHYSQVTQALSACQSN